jgi:hypothetical protein
LIHWQRIGLEVEPEGGGEFVLAILGAKAAGAQQGESRAPEIEIESDRANYHSGDTKSEHASKVKTDMGQQSNKTIKRKRANAYLKRKKVAIKAKKKKTAA